MKFFRNGNSSRAFYIMRITSLIIGDVHFFISATTTIKPRGVNDWKCFSNDCSNPQSINPSIMSKLHVGGEYPWPIETPIETTKTAIKQ